MASIAQYVFPPATPVSAYAPLAVEVERRAGRHPNATPVAAISAGSSAVAAALTVDPTGTNNSIDYTAATAGVAGNSITIAYVNDGASQTIDVDVAGTAITVSLATDSGSVITSTAANVRTAIAAHAGAAALVGTANHAGNDGTGLVTAIAATPLAAGADAVGTTQALIAADGTLTLTLDAGQYVVAGQVGSVWNYLAIAVDA